MSIAKSDLILERLKALHPRSIDLSLRRMTRLLRALGNPQDHLPPVVHVAGTNGKGSVIAYMRAMLEAAGYSVHVSTSPHLIRFREQIRLAGAIIDEDYWSDVLARSEGANGGRPITFFEITTAAAFLAYSETPADILLLETGMGGRLDATNVVERPALSVITPISTDHTEFLGEALTEIAGEKAGILRADVTAVVGPQLPAPADVFERQCRRLGAPLVRHGSDWQTQITDTGFSFAGFGADLTLPLPALTGRHQIDNAGIAIAALRNLGGFDVADPHIRNGLLTVDWPARLQRLQGGPLVAQAPDGAEIWLDGGHNAAAGQAIADTMLELAEKDAGPRPLALIVGMLNSKDPAEFLRPFRGIADSVVATAIPQEERAWATDAMVDAGRRAGVEMTGAETPSAAMTALCRHYEGRAAPRILACGSLYLAGQVLTENH